MFDPVYAAILFLSIMLVWAIGEALVAVFGITAACIATFLFNRRNGPPNPEDRI